jgi:hypothetical protein
MSGITVATTTGPKATAQITLQYCDYSREQLCCGTSCFDVDPSPSDRRLRRGRASTVVVVLVIVVVVEVIVIIRLTVVVARPGDQ